MIAPTPKILTPPHIAAIKLAELFGYIALINALIALSQYLSLNQHVNWTQLATFVAAQVVLALVVALSKYFKSLANPQLFGIGVGIQVLADQVAQRLQVSQANLITDIQQAVQQVIPAPTIAPIIPISTPAPAQVPQSAIPTMAVPPSLPASLPYIATTLGASPTPLVADDPMVNQDTIPLAAIAKP